MNTSTKLRAQRAEKVVEMEKLAAVTGSRLMTNEERSAFEAAKSAVGDLDRRIDEAEAAEGRRRAIDDNGNAHAILKAGDRLAARHVATGAEPLNIARALKGIVTGDWAGAEGERRAMSEGSLSAGGYAVPTELSAQWLDMARAKSVCVAAGAGTIAMNSQSLRIAKIEEDLAPGFRPEHVALAENAVTFGAVDLRARLVGVVARASIELIADSPIANDMIVASITGALGVAMDHAMLAGDGVVDATHDNPTGILNAAGVNAIPVGGALADYDHFLDAMEMIEAANLAPSAVVLAPAVNNSLRKLKTGLSGDLTKLTPPADVSALGRFVTTSMSDAAIVGDFSNALFGMREGITIEATRVGADALSKAQVLIRGYMRLDVGLARAKAFAKLTGITA